MPAHVFGAKARGLLAHVLYQFWALDALRKAGKVFYQRGKRELAAGLVAFNHQRFQVGAGRIDGRRKTGATGA
jgi:hypothetical protein